MVSAVSEIDDGGTEPVSAAASWRRYNRRMAIVLPIDLTTQEIRVLQEFRRLKTESLTPAQIEAIRHPAGGGLEPMTGLERKGYVEAADEAYRLTEKGKALLAVEPVP